MKYLLTTILLLEGFLSAAQKYTTCKIYQYEGAESAEKQLVAEKLYNAEGKLASSWYKDCKEDLIENYANRNSIFSYENSLLMSRLTGFDNGDSTETRFMYDESGRKLLEVDYSYKRHPEHGNIYRNEGFITIIKDDDQQKKWKSTGRTAYYYDEKGNVTVRKSENELFHSHDIDSLFYDKKERLTGIKAYSDANYGDTKLKEEQRYLYSGKKYTYFNIYYDEAGKSDTLYTITTSLSSKGKVISERTDAKVSYWESSKIFEYDKNGRLILEKICDKKGTPQITHEYVYE